HIPFGTKVSDSSAAIAHTNVFTTDLPYGWDGGRVSEYGAAIHLLRMAYLLGRGYGDSSPFLYSL
ncbi:MAG: hypothetical protein LC772_08290, partial [Chloroflexi bacterium]|nr:hypothetical protein [Chloroflexota bacterium]